jgi:hypothetical protein
MASEFPFTVYDKNFIFFFISVELRSTLWDSANGILNTSASSKVSEWHKKNPPLSGGNIWFGNKEAMHQRRLSKWSSLLSTGRVPDQAGGEHHGGGRREEHHLSLHGERT